MRLEEMNKFFLWALAAGFGWGVLGSGISYWVFGESVLAGFLVSPLIELLLATAYVPVYRSPKWLQALASLGTLYVAVASFGLAMGVYETLWPIPNRFGVDGVLTMAFLAVLGITVMGFVLVLWPLMFLTHRLLRRALPDSSDEDVGPSSRSS